MPSYPPVLYSVGTTPVQVLVAKDRRLQYQIVYPNATKVAGNTGVIYVGIGFVPTATGGSLSAGHIMIPGDSFGETITPGYSDVSKEAVYVVASAATQIIEVYEVTP